MRRQFAVLAALAIVAGCETDITTPGNKIDAARLTPDFELNAAANGRFERGTEDDVLRLENFLPGLGGIYMDGSNIVVYAPSGMERRDILSKIALGATTLNLDASTYQQMIRGENIVVRPAKYAFSQLVSWVEAGAGGVMRTPGVTGIDANEATNRITLFIKDSSVITGALAVARAAGLPADAFDFVISNAVLASGLRGTWSTTMGGIQIQNDEGVNCSLGYNDQYNEIKGFWTAGHCSKYRFDEGALGESIYQPTWSQGALGSVIMRSEFTVSSVNCGTAVYCSYVDAMYVQHVDQSRWASRVARLEGLTSIASDRTPVIGDVAGWWTNVNLRTLSSSWWVGIPVDKVGRTSGWSRGKLGYTCQTQTFNIPGSSLTHTILCNDIIVPDTLSGGGVNVPYGGGGDSGGPVFISNNNTSTELKALGIAVAFKYDPAVIVEGGYACTNSNCWVYYNRLLRIKMFVRAPY